MVEASDAHSTELGDNRRGYIRRAASAARWHFPLGDVLGMAAFTLLTPAFALGQNRTREWRWGMHPMMFMWGVGGLVMMLTMLVF